MHWKTALAALALLAAACGGSSPPAKQAHPTTAPVAAGGNGQPSSAPQLSTGQLPKSCNDRVSAADVSAAVGKPVKLVKETLEGGVTCLYDSENASPSVIGYGARISYQALEKTPTQSDVDDFVNTLSAQLKGQATIEHMTGVGDYSGWIVITPGDIPITVWAVVAAKGKLYVEFSTWSGFAQGDKTRQSEVVRKALG